MYNSVQHFGGIRRAAFFCQTAVVFPLPPLPHPTHLPAGHKKINMQIFPIFWKPLRVQHETYTCWEGCIKNRFSGQKAWRCATRSTENLSFWCPVMMVITHLQQCHSVTTALSVFICQIHINIYVYIHARCHVFWELRLHLFDSLFRYLCELP